MPIADIYMHMFARTMIARSLFYCYTIETLYAGKLYASITNPKCTSTPPPPPVEEGGSGGCN